MPDLPLQGSAGDIFLPRLFGQLHLNGFEGVVRLTLGQTAKVVYYKAGEIASAASNAESDRLAHIFIGSGRLTREQLDLARGRVAPGGSLGKTLIGMGFLTPAELLAGARDQVRQILDSCFLLTSGVYRCDPGPLPREVTVLGLPTKRLIFDSLMQASDRAWIVRELGSMESVYAPTDALAPGLRALRLDPDLSEIAGFLDGTQTLRDLSSRTSRDDFTVSKLFLALEILGMTRLVGAPPSAAAPRGRRVEVTSDVEPEEPEPVLIEETGEPLGSEPPSLPVAGEVAPSADEGAMEPPAEAAPPWADEPVDEEAPAAIPDAGMALDEPADRPGDHLADGAPDQTEPAAAPGRRDDPDWEIDPSTGERVAFGPVELTFDGKVSPGREGRFRWTRPAALAAAAVVLIAASLFVFMRRGGDAGDVTSIAGSAVRTTRTGRAAPAREEPAPGPVAPGSPAGAIEERGGADRTEAETEEKEAPMEVEPAAMPRDAPGRAAPPAEAVAAGEQAAPPATGPSPGEEPAGARTGTPPPAPRETTRAFRDAARYDSALRALDGGDARAAAALFLEMVAEENPDRFTMQLMIACEIDTLRSARASAGDRGSLFFVPFSFKGRDCFRVCWGAYPSRSRAIAARSDLPPAFREAGLDPIVLQLLRLRPAS